MANKRDLVVATLNLFNLHDQDGRTYSTRTPAFPDDAAYEARIRWLADAVEQLDADLIGLQELWSVRALEDVFEAAGLDDAYDLHARDAPGLGKPQVALAVRKGWTLEPPQWIADFPETFRFEGFRERNGAEEPISISIRAFSRPVLRCVVRPPATRPTPPPITVYVAHFKSKGPANLAPIGDDAPALDAHGSVVRSAVAHIRRMMEAGALRAMLDEEMVSSDADDLSPTIVMGDLNDATHAVSTELLSAQPSYRLAASSRAGSRSDKGLYTVETLQQYRSQRHVYYTYIFKNKNETLDHIMVSEEFYDHSEKRHWSFVEMELVNDHLNAADESRSRKREYLRRTGAVDHGIVRAEFAWDPIAADLERLRARLD